MPKVVDGIKNLGRKRQKDKPDNNGELKRVHIVEMRENKVAKREDVNLTPGTKISNLKAKLGYGLEDDVIRAKNRQPLADKVDLYALVEPDEKIIIVPDTGLGV